MHKSLKVGDLTETEIDDVGPGVVLRFFAALRMTKQTLRMTVQGNILNKFMAGYSHLPKRLWSRRACRLMISATSKTGGVWFGLDRKRRMLGK